MVGTMAKIDDSVKKKVPELRFKGFTDEWEERKLKDIAQFNPKTVLPDEFEYVDLESVVGTEMISHRTESKDQAPSRAQRLAQKGDVFYQTVRPYQMNNYLYDLPYDNYVFSTGYAQMRPNIDSYFLLNSVQNKQFVQHVLDRSTGTSYPAINSSDLSNIEIHVPSKLSEQQKIGAFFQSIDDTIALHQRKLDLLKEQKKGYLQKMFPKNGAKVPELRFAGFADDWEQRKLGEVATFLNGRAYKQDELLDSGKYKVLRVGNFYTNDSWYYSNMELGDKYYVDKGDLVYTWSATFGPHIWSGEKVIYHYHIWKVELSKFLDRNFTLQLLEADKARLLSSTNGSTMIHVTKGDMESKIVSIPNIDEQKQIGSFFKQLDNTITLHQRKLDLLKEQKKGFLQNMFV